MNDTKKPPQNLNIADLLRYHVEHADNLPYGSRDEDYYNFYVFDYANPVGHIRPQFMDGTVTVKWPEANFAVDHKRRTVKLCPKFRGEGCAEVCREAMIDFCRENKENFPKAFKPWLKKPDEDTRDSRGNKMDTPDKKDYHGIIGLEGKLEGLCSATPARGIFGLATAGVHVNVYEAAVDKQGKEGAITKVWLSKRTPQQTFPNSYDQVAAGAVDDTDLMDRLSALKRELESETHFKLYKDNKTILDRHNKPCGELKCIELNGNPRPSEHVISIATRKGDLAGPKETGHLEYAIRFAYDLRLDPGCVPEPGEKTTFVPVKVQDLARDGFVEPWKYSSGAVFIDFIMRHKLMRTDQETRKVLWDRLHRDIPFQNAKRYQTWSKTNTY